MPLDGARKVCRRIGFALTSGIPQTKPAQAFSAGVNRNGMKSPSYPIDTPAPFRAAPVHFCFDIYRYFDIDTLAAPAAPEKIFALCSLR
jgi:hypothetical protein